ncbi:MAG: nucleotidyltransferase domain-containing protein [Gammaproteobacteria bacterium]|nr:nucleotidyltransferase domain-containing protein [Gammaproteobacteria bacterium]NIR81987.1 nucleotidyltransferase domain-containing protein [Gammaproteobacteria bacterium]NIR89044.1 nucleotidyltransferase domain-containing protein [Gammaproteobacteria bacterium]NIU03094.1 nucleotidyltransferase domain-containing protein [Gammaproteobacteria bacterium]NIV50618.1 nucleotidyltransferase domain-containing protein [Gammaproteobacteria bacterium]
MDQAVRAWVRERAASWPELERLGYFGSYARGDWGVGSDLDLVAIVSKSDEPFDRRPMGVDLNELPLPADVLIYTKEEWNRLRDEGNAFVRMLAAETVWVYPPEDDASHRS